MSVFTKDGANEFRRDKPLQSGALTFSLVHKIVPLVICLLSLVISTQFLADRLGYDPSILGYPWFILNNYYPVYYPSIMFALMIRGIGTNDQVMGKIIFDSTMILVIGIFTGVMVYFILSWARTAMSRRQNIHGTSRWATAKDIQAIGLFEDAGVVIGQQENAKVDYAMIHGSVKLSLRRPSKILRHSGQTSTIMFAPTRSGKGVSSVIPTCIDYPHSLITIDPKGENFNMTAGWRRKFSHVLRLSPVSNDTLQFNILDELSDDCVYRDASMIADILTSPADGKIDGSSKHWTDTAKDLITGTILHVKFSDYPDKSLYGVLAFLSQAGSAGGNADEEDRGLALLDIMINERHSSFDIHEIVCNVARRNKARPPDERGSVFSTAVTALQIFEDPLVRNCSSSSDFCLNDFKVSEHPLSLYITVPFPDLDRLSSFIRIIVTFILRKFSQDEVQFGVQKLKHPILFLIDEFPTLGTFTALETMMGILAGYGITFYLICQSPSQIYRLYGEHTTIFDHCKFIMTYAMSDPKGAEMFSKMTGVESVTFSNVSKSGSRYEAGMNNINISEQTQQRNLMNADEIQHLPANQLIIFSQGSPAIIAKKNVYYADPRYKDKVNLPVPRNRRELLLECPHNAGFRR
ncbi:MAG: type IV secretory system conjugative DNA transfer family protein [Treponema sp.]|jgi:type IV secretion system protein VirD4|nr:type IV secretory system conjugative DNA transfer family protein [Treponema sp.]